MLNITEKLLNKVFIISFLWYGILESNLFKKSSYALMWHYKEQICNVTSQFLEQIAQFGSHYVVCHIQGRLSTFCWTNCLFGWMWYFIEFSLLLCTCVQLRQPLSVKTSQKIFAVYVHIWDTCNLPPENLGYGPELYSSFCCYKVCF